MLTSTQDTSGTLPQDQPKLLVSLVDPSLDARLFPTKPDGVRLDPSAPSVNTPQSTCRSTATSTTKIVSLLDPASGAPKSYLFNKSTKTLAELTSISLGDVDRSEDTFSSMFVHGRYVVGNEHGRTIYVTTMVDPLFWVLSMNQNAPEVSPASNSDASNTKTTMSPQGNRARWEPCAQILAPPLDPILQECFTDSAAEKQLRNLYASMKIEDGNDSFCYYYKFDAARALQWLQTKQQAVRDVLLASAQSALWNDPQQRKNEQAGQKDEFSSARSSEYSAMAANFSLAGEEPPPRAVVKEGTTTKDDSHDACSHQKVTNTCAASDLSTKSLELIHAESIQVVCSYLTPAWREAFLKHLNVSAAKVLQTDEKASNKKQKTRNGDTTMAKPITSSSVDWNVRLTMGLDAAAPTGQAKADAAALQAKKRPVTAGSKRLAKVNKRGMSKMSSFFAAAPSKPKTTKVAAVTSAKASKGTSENTTESRMITPPSKNCAKTSKPNPRRISQD